LAIPLHRAVRILAAAEVVRPPERQSVDYQIRQILRAYSDRFRTPLHVVEDLPLVRVLRHYWEDRYERLWEGDKPDVDSMREELRQLAMTPDELTQRRERPSEEAADLVRFFEAAAAQAAQGPVKGVFGKIPEQLRAEPEPAPEAAPAPDDLSIDFEDFE